MAISGHGTNYSVFNSVHIEIFWTQSNFNPNNESFDISYTINVSFSPTIPHEKHRNFKLTFDYIIDDKIVRVINAKTINPSSSFTNVASGTITIKSNQLSNMIIPWNVNCIVSYQSGIETLGDNVAWTDGQSLLDHTFNLDGFKSPTVNSVVPKITIFEEYCSTITFNIKEAYKNLKYTAILNFKDYSEEIFVNKTLTETLIEYTPPISWIYLMPDSETILNANEKPKVTIISYNTNGKQVGTGFSFYSNLEIDESVKPSIENLLLEKISDTVPDEWDLLVQGNSQAKITMQNISPGKGAKIKEYHIYDNIGNISSATTLTTDTLLKSGILEFNAYVIDSRNRKSNIKTFSINVEPYSYPSIIEYYAKRCNRDMELIDNGKNILAKINASYSLCNYKNSIIDLSVKVKKSINDEIISTDNINLNNETLLSGLYDPEYSYLVTFTISDCLHTSNISILVSTSNATIDLKKGGKGIAFGKVSELDGFECEFDAYFNNNLYIIFDGIKKELKSLLQERITLDKIVNSTEITEAGYLIDGKCLSDALFEINNSINSIINTNRDNYIIDFGASSIKTESKETDYGTFSNGYTTINLNKPFTSKPFILLQNNSSKLTNISVSSYDKSTNSLDIYGYYDIGTSSTTIHFDWFAIQEI